VTIGIAVFLAPNCDETCSGPPIGCLGIPTPLSVAMKQRKSQRMEAVVLPGVDSATRRLSAPVAPLPASAPPAPGKCGLLPPGVGRCWGSAERLPGADASLACYPGP